MPTTPSKAEQDAEAHARAENNRLRGLAPIPAGETAAVLDTPGDAPQDPLEGQHAPQPAPQAEPPPVPQQPKPGHTLGDKTRAEIMARFRTERTVPTEGETDEIAQFAKSAGMPEEFRDAVQPEPEPQPVPATEAAPQPAPEPTQAPRTIKVTVHGKEEERPLDEVIAKAQIAYAADNILDAAKSKFKEIEALEEGFRNRVQRGDPSGQHQAGPTAQPAEPGAPQPSEFPNTTEDPFQKVVEAIQFGDPAEAKTLLQNTIGQVADAATQRALLQQRIADDRATAKRVLDEFSQKHQDIASDDFARAAIERSVFDHQIDDLKTLNVDLGKIRNDGQPATPADVANYHQFLRSQGFNVRSPGQLLEAAHGKFLEWKGVKPTEPAADPATPAPQPAPQSRTTTAPRVQITVDRQARQAAPQPQPPGPRPAPPPPPRPQDTVEARSSIVQAMQARKAKLRGQNLGLG